MIESVIEVMLETLSIEPPETHWEELGAVIAINAKGNVINNYGYAFSPDGDWHAVTGGSLALRPPVSSYLSELYPDGKYPVRMLVQFNRESGKYSVDFEDTDEGRWAISPSRLEESIEALRPDFS